MTTVAANPNVPPIPSPGLDQRQLATTALALKQGVESLGGTRGDPMGRAVTFNDLVRLGLTTELAIKARIAG